jgi:hypothetical protein
MRETVTPTAPSALALSGDAEADLAYGELIAVP